MCSSCSCNVGCSGGNAPTLGLWAAWTPPALLCRVSEDIEVVILWLPCFLSGAEESHRAGQRPSPARCPLGNPPHLLSCIPAVPGAPSTSRLGASIRLLATRASSACSPQEVTPCLSFLCCDSFPRFKSMQSPGRSLRSAVRAEQHIAQSRMLAATRQLAHKGTKQGSKGSTVVPCALQLRA